MKRIMTLEKLPDLVGQILEKLHNLKLDTATILTLQGDLGAGKTTLTQEISKQLGVKDKVISPTFVIMKKYDVVDKKFKNLIHIDAYRFEKSNEILKLGWEEIIKNKNNLIILEWPEIVSEFIPENALKIKLFHVNDTNREIEF